MSRRHASVLAAVALACSACGSSARQTAPERTTTAAASAPAVRTPHCRPGRVRTLGDARRAYAAFAPNGAVVYRTPAGAVRARFGKLNVNGYPTVFGVVG